MSYSKSLSEQQPQEDEEAKRSASRLAGNTALQAYFDSSMSPLVTTNGGLTSGIISNCTVDSSFISNFVGNTSRMGGEPLALRSFLSSLLSWLIMEHPSSFAGVGGAIEVWGGIVDRNPGSTVSIPLKELYTDYTLMAPEDAPRVVSSSTTPSMRLAALFLLERGQAPCC